MSDGCAPIGIIVNPRAGTDVRRAVSAAANVTVEAKANVVRRVVLGAMEAGANRFVVQEDPHSIVRRATETIRGIHLDWVDEVRVFTEEDTVTAVSSMRDRGVAVVVVLGGDGTNRAAARAWQDIPVIPVSTGTNNAFPVFVEATVAGSAAGHLACGLCGVDEVSSPAKVVRLRIEGVGAEPPLHDMALIDAVAVDDPYVGSFELFDPSTLKLAVLARADPMSIGFAGVGGRVEPVSPEDDAGLLLRFGPADGCPTVVRAPTAPGHFDDLGLAEVRRLSLGEEVGVDGPVLMAFDGERKRRLGGETRAVLTVQRDGPRVVDVAAVMAAAVSGGAYTR
ncbi:MAG: NAD(+)/NADH kinase [Acidimicrobiia bacterium]|nr:NAD(+)/NADH kinase [Actinomycetota bacterium]MBL6925104.1 NAD(+)/NADH kinase [Acidimicrobiia bacterium]MBL6926464.1 NAD(+)/NADH kinase [Acidimicrobiia bacterium]